MTRYIGLDAHSQTCTVAVMGPSGKRLREKLLETNAKLLVDFIRDVPRPRHLCMEEGALSEWLYEVIEPHVDELVVVQPAKRSGNKNDSIDAWGCADQIRRGVTATQVFKAPGRMTRLRAAVQGYQITTRDLVRTKNRLNAVYRSRGVTLTDRGIYDQDRRSSWLEKLPPASRQLAELLGAELDGQLTVREQAETWLLEEARRVPDVRLLMTVPGIAEVRAAQILAVVIDPFRFRTKQQFWSYSGLAVVTRSSADWHRTPSGQFERRKVALTRGLNRNRQPMLKAVFKGAAKTVIDRMSTHPLHASYQRMVDAGVQPNLARLTLARRIAAATLACWKSKEDYDSAKHCAPDQA